MASTHNNSTTAVLVNSTVDDSRHDEDFIDYFSTDEQFYAYVQIPPAFLSLLCSCFIIYHVVRTRLLTDATARRRTRVRQGNSFPRMLIGLCALDGLSSLTLILEPLVALGAPQPPVGHWTCTGSGFTKIVGTACGSIYNGMIAMYFYLVVVRNWTDDYVEKWYEPAGHALVVAFLLFWAGGIPLEAYNPNWGITECWAGSYPPACTADGADGTLVCTRGYPWGGIYDWVYTAGFMVVLLTIVVSNVCIFCTVRHLTRRNQRYHSGRESTATHSTTQTSTTMDDSQTVCKHSDAILNRDRTKEVAIKSFLYSAGYLGTYLATFVAGIAGLGTLPSHHGTWWYRVVRTLQEVTFPLQGFLNFCAYIYPKFMEWREVQLYRDGKPHRLKALWEAMSTKPFPDPGTVRIMKRDYLNSLRESRTNKPTEEEEKVEETEKGMDNTGTSHSISRRSENTNPTIRSEISSLQEVSFFEGVDSFAELAVEEDAETPPFFFRRRSELFAVPEVPSDDHDHEDNTTPISRFATLYGRISNSFSALRQETPPHTSSKRPSAPSQVFVRNRSKSRDIDVGDGDMGGANAAQSPNDNGGSPVSTADGPILNSPLPMTATSVATQMATTSSRSLAHSAPKRLDATVRSISAPHLQDANTSGNTKVAEMPHTSSRSLAYDATNHSVDAMRGMAEDTV